jgi:2-keto-4-pentenoate hydratase/2-oxohepta-3-ene-1,7-dioic acid hydratase in catechol pathway
LLSPIAPSTCPYIRCIGLNYKRHAEVSYLFEPNPLLAVLRLTQFKEAKMALPKEPVLFTKPRTSIADPFPGTLRIPKFAQDETNDYEAELAVVIGKSARDVSPEEAPNYILGFTVSNDVSARAQQMQNPLPTFSKGLDSSCPLGTK